LVSTLDVVKDEVVIPEPDEDLVSNIDEKIGSQIDDIIKIPYTEPGEETISSIPEWVKNNAGWWIEGKISDTEFAMALQYLVKTGIITVNLSKA